MQLILAVKVFGSDCQVCRLLIMFLGRARILSGYYGDLTHQFRSSIPVTCVAINLALVQQCWYPSY